MIHAALLGWSRDRVMAVMAQSLQRTEPPVFRYRLDEAGVAESSAMGTVQLPWSSFGALREGREFVFLLRAPLDGGMFIAFPREQLPAPALAALRAHVPG